MRIYCLLFCWLNLLYFSHCAKILGIFPFPTYSHYILGSRIMKEMVKRGHEVTFISFFKEPTLIKNYNEIVLPIKKGEKEEIISLHFGNKLSATDNIDLVLQFNTVFADLLFKNHEFKQILNESFDLIVYDVFTTHIYTALGHHFKCPVVLLSTTPPSIYTNFVMGNPHYSSYVPNLVSPYPTVMNLWQRFFNIYYDIYALYQLYMKTIPAENEILQQSLGPMPHLKDLMYNASLMLCNSHPSINVPAPVVPGIKEIAGAHIHLDPKRLPENLREFLDKSFEGVILISMGSILESSLIPKERKDIFFNVIKKFPKRFLWKYEESVKHQPDNLLISEWIPQLEVLAHPNVIAFVSHCGAFSVIESIYYGVPLICIPVYADQFINGNYAFEKQYGLTIPYRELTEEKLTKALEKILKDSKFQEKAREHSEILRSTPQKPMDTATFWLEYVIRHKGALHLRTAVLNLKWYQIFMFDIILLLFLLILTLFSLHFVFKYGYKRITLHLKKNK